MLDTLELLNFKAFENHTVSFKPLTVIVGRNNAGKSTLVEALRLVSVVVNRYRHLIYRKPPEWLDIPVGHYGVSPSLKGMEINFDNLCYRYSQPPAVISASFTDGSKVVIYLSGESLLHAVIRDHSGKVINSRKASQDVKLPTVGIMPQIGPVAREETALSEDYVKRAMSSSLAPSHFRNQINAIYSLFSKFQAIVEETWPTVQVLELIVHYEYGKVAKGPLTLHVRDGNFVAEIAAMGHGLQMWLQTMWFLTRSENASSIILDEPDVYMHADLQRRLIRYVRGRHPQVIMTSHSIEVISEVEPEEILIIDRVNNKSSFATSLPAVQKLVESFGSVQNIHLARLWHSHRFIMVEGKDLKIFQNTLFPDSEVPFDSIPNMSIGGWGGWSYVIGSTMALKNAGGEDILTYCILDSDDHNEEEIKKRYSDAKERGVHLHIWSQKEIENYLLIPQVIHRVIKSRIAKRTKPPETDEVTDQIDKIVSEMEEDVFDAISTGVLTKDRSLGSGGANKRAREILKSIQTLPEGLKRAVSGKSVIAALSTWCQDEFGISLSASAIAKEISPNEVPEEVALVIARIECSDPF